MAKRTSEAAKVKKALTARDGEEIFVGVDVHKKSYHVAVWKSRCLAATWTTSADDAALVRTLARAKGAVTKVVYEAGPTGFSLARRLADAGLPVAVVAASKIPAAPARAAKSDRLDASKLAEFSAKDLLPEIGVPSVEDEDYRLLVRSRDDVVEKIARVKQQVRSLVLFVGMRVEDSAVWSERLVASFRALPLREAQRIRLECLLSELEFHKKTKKRIELELKSNDAKRQGAIDILQSHPGVGPVVARAFAAEIFRPERFASAAQVVSYVGLAPCSRESGETRRGAGRLPGGRPGLRAKLVEAAWAWMRTSDEGRELYRRYLRNTGSGKKAIVALARKLTVRLWTMLVNGEFCRAAA